MTCDNVDLANGLLPAQRAAGDDQTSVTSIGGVTNWAGQPITWPVTPPETPGHADLIDVLALLARAGIPAPCVVLPGAGWTADTIGEQREAARMCADCAAVAECGAYAYANPDELGVYGGRTQSGYALRRPRAS